MNLLRMGRHNRKVTVIALISVVITLGIKYVDSSSSSMPFKFGEFLSIFSSVVTLIIAFILYDVIDSRKLAFNKKAEAVDKLFSKLSDLEVLLFPYTKGEMTLDKNNPIRITKRKYASFYLNYHNLKTKENPDLHTLPIFFSPAVLEQIRIMTNEIMSPWIPMEIGRKLKPIIIFSSRKNEGNIKPDEKFVLVSTREERPEINVNFYSISYGDKKVENYITYLNYNRELLNAIRDWYLLHFDELPDMVGDFNDNIN